MVCSLKSISSLQCYAYTTCHFLYDFGNRFKDPITEGIKRPRQPVADIFLDGFRDLLKPFYGLRFGCGLPVQVVMGQDLHFQVLCLHYRTGIGVNE